MRNPMILPSVSTRLPAVRAFPLVFLIVPVLAMAPAAAAGGSALEVDILDQYLAQFDYQFGGERIIVTYCERQGGFEATGEWPNTPQVGHTNGLLHEHAEWHWARTSIAEPGWSRTDADPYGQEFLQYHHDLVHDYESWRAANGHRPLIAWDPSGPIPAAFAYDMDLPCLNRDTDAPDIARPSWLTREGGEETDGYWWYTSLCEFPSWNRLGKALEGGYHTPVHEAVGGDMANLWVSPREPVFWAWHKQIDAIAHEWESCPRADDGGDHAAVATLGAPGASREAPAVSGLSVAVAGALASLVAAAVVRVRR